MNTTRHDPHFDGYRVISDPPTNCRHYNIEGPKLRRYDYSGNCLYGPPKKVKLGPVTKIRLQSSKYLDEDRAFNGMTPEYIKDLPEYRRWTPGSPPAARQDWVHWAIDRMRVLGLTYERLYEQARIQQKNGVYSKKDIEKLNLLLERLAPGKGKSVSTVLNR